jgi:hypothetical protein
MPAKPEGSENTVVRLVSPCAVSRPNVKKISEDLDNKSKYGKTVIREDYHGLLSPPLAGPHFRRKCSFESQV